VSTTNPSTATPQRTAVKRSYPVSFSLLDNDDQPVMDIVDDDSEGRDLILKITNRSGRELQLVDLGAGDATDEHHHFELRFRPKVLNTKTRITVDDGWSLSEPTVTQGVVSLYLLSKKSVTLAADEPILLKLQQVSADGRGGARGTRVELKYQNLQYVSGTPNPEALADGQREQQLSIVNQRGKKTIPLHVGFVGSNTILNDGSPSDERTLRITNVLKGKSLPLSTTGKAITKFILWFDVYDPEERNEWALGDKGSVGNIHIDAVGGNWIVKNPEQGETPEWIITPTENKTTLEGGESIQLKLSGIVSARRTGPTDVYVGYENISGYWDGQFITTLEKSKLIQRDQLDANGNYAQQSNVGIGTTKPRQKLEVAGNIQLGVRSKLFYQGDPSANHFGSLAFHTFDGGKSAIVIPCNAAGDYLPDSTVNLGGFGSFDSNKVSVAVSGNVGISNKLSVTGNADFSGNVGIGTNLPKQKLEIHDGDGLVQIGRTSPTLVTGSDNGGAIYFGGDRGVGGDEPTAAIETSWGGNLNPQISIGVTREFSGRPGANLLMDFSGDTNIRQGETSRLFVQGGTGNVGIGTSEPKGRLNISEKNGTAASPSQGTIILDHEDNTGASSVVFRSNRNRGSDYGYIQYQDSDFVGVGNENARLVIGIENDTDDHLILKPSGNVGIGTNGPQAKLHVRGDVCVDGTVGLGESNPTVPLVVKGFKNYDLGGGFWFAFKTESRIAHDGSHFNSISIKASDGIQSETGFYVTSDLRIKKELKKSDPHTDLEILSQLQVTDYKHIDFVHHGDKHKKGLIAQQVEKVFPQAIVKQTDVVPDIYQPAAFADGWVLLATDLQKGERIRLISEKAEGIYEVLEAATDKFRTDFKPEGEKLFVFGREVDDFRILDYDAISMLNVSATQQLKKEKDEEVKVLRTEITDLKSANDALQQRLALLESKFETSPGGVVAKNGSNGNGTH
jgi:hypothetical protein